LTQWIDDTAYDKLWSIEPASDGYVRLYNQQTSQYTTPMSSEIGAQVSFKAKSDTDDSQLWKLVRDPEQTKGAVADPISDITVYLGSDIASQLPKTVKVTYPNGSVEYDDGSIADEPIAWNKSTLPANDKIGEFTVSGTVTTVPVSTKVIVVESGETPITVDKTALKQAIGKAEQINAYDYTDESMKALRDALAAAKKVYDDSGASQEQVNQAQNALDLALSGLVAKDKEDDSVSTDKNNSDGNPDSAFAQTTNKHLAVTGSSAVAIAAFCILFLVIGLSALKIRRRKI
jgi:hypothetical protein